MALRREWGGIPDGPLNDRMRQAANDVEEEEIVLNLPPEDSLVPAETVEDLAKKYPKPPQKPLEKSQIDLFSHEKPANERQPDEYRD